MNQFVALLKREHLEHWGAFFFTPLVIFALMFLLGLSLVSQVDEIQVRMSERISSEHGTETHSRSWSSRRDGSAGDMDDSREELSDELHEQGLGIFGLDIAGTTDAELRHRLRSAFGAVSMPFYWILLIVLFIGCIACMHDERKDRSVLFWKSMPVSDTQTVLSKYLYLVWLAPIATIVAILVAQVYLLVVLSAFVEDGMAGRLWTESGLITYTLQLVVGYLLNGLTILPVFAWVMLVSAWFNSVPFLWAIGIPFWFSFFEQILFGTEFLRDFVGYHIKMPTLPRDSFQGDAASHYTTLADQFSVFGQGQFWVGLIVGAALLAATIYVRRLKNEI